MDIFKPVTTENIMDAISLFKAASSKICDDTIGVTYQWRKLFQTDILIKSDCLVTRSVYPMVGRCYSFPLGEGKPEDVFSILHDDAKEHGDPFCFACVTEDRLAIIKDYYGGAVKIEEKRNWADYIYDPSNFSYSGKRFHTQKNHVNRFYREHPEAKLEQISNDNIEEVSAFLDKMVNNKPDMPAWERGEIEGTRDLLYMWKQLNQIGAFLRTDMGIAAFAMGELRGNTLFIHAEKANTNFSGAYPAIAQAFSKFAARDVKYINREDDADDPGIRFSKEQYRPLCLIPKYLVTVEEI